LKYKNYFTLFYLFLLFWTGCNSENPVGNQQKVYPDYFPDKSGYSYVYRFSVTDATGENEGMRYVYYSGSSVINGVAYTNQYDSVSIDTINSSGITYFRKSGTGIFYYVDTAEVIQSIPDSLREGITLQEERRLLLYPLQQGSFWTSYKVSVSLPSGIVFNPVIFNGSFVVLEDINLDLTSGSMDTSAAKVKFDLQIIRDPNKPAQNYSAFLWFTENLGIVKSEGNGIILNALLTGKFNLEDSTIVIKQNLIEYNLK